MHTKFATAALAAIAGAATLDCGDGLKVVSLGDSFDCTAADPPGDTRTARITASRDGEFWEVLD
jgi:hypothetical protein